MMPSCGQMRGRWAGQGRRVLEQLAVRLVWEFL